MQTTGAFFDIFDAPPILGRTYRDATDKPGAAVAVISETVWKQHFGSDPSVIGTKVRLNGAPVEIIGVAQAFLRHPDKSGVWMLSPFDVPTSPFGVGNIESRDVHYFNVVGRVADGRSLVEGIQQVKTIGDDIARTHASNAGSTFKGEALAANMVATRAEASSSRPLICQEIIVCPRACQHSIGRSNCDCREWPVRRATPPAASTPNAGLFQGDVGRVTTL